MPKRFTYIYNGEDSEGESEVEGEQSRKIYSDDEVFAKEFGWYHWLYTSADGRYLDIKDILQQPAMEWLTFVNYSIRKNQVEADKIRKLHNKK
jgi:hypothetical protein